MDDCRPAQWLIAIRAEFLSNNHFDPAVMFMGIGDSGYALLRFRANKQTIERIVTSARVYEIDEDMFKKQADSKSPPIYWKPFEGKSALFYESQRFDDSFGAGRAILCYDESTTCPRG